MDGRLTGPGGCAADLTALRVALAAAAAAAQRDKPGTSGRSAVAAACGELLPGDGSAVTLMSGDEDRSTVYASDHVLRDLAKREYTLGQGPSLSAFRTRRPVLVSDMTSAGAIARWPMLAEEITHLPVRALATFPLQVGMIRVGVASVYRQSPGLFAPSDMTFILDALDMLTVALLSVGSDSPAQRFDVGWLEPGALARDQVHQATGMLIAQLGVDARTAFAALRREAAAFGLDVDFVADRIVNHRYRVRLRS